jgi:hypothetical protein
MSHEHPQVRVSPIFPAPDLQRALAAERASVKRTGAPVDPDYGVREDWHIEPDGNLLRSWSPIASAR